MCIRGIRRGNCSTHDIEEILRARHADLVRFEEAADAAFLIVE
jgi:hypothetical protein